MSVEYRNVRGHVEVYENGQFIFSEDNHSQAIREYNSGYCEHLGGYCGYNDNCENCDFIQPCLIEKEY